MKVRIAVEGGIKIYIWIIMLGISKAWAQDPQFSQYYANPIYTNPALAGSSNVGRLALNYRSQWPSISGSFRTFSASYDEHYDALSGGIGFIATTDEAGVGTLRTNSASAIYAYQIILSKNITMRVGIEGGFFQKTIDFSKLIFLDQIKERIGVQGQTGEEPRSTVFQPNFSAGTVIYSNRFYAGFAMHNLNQPKLGFYGSDDSKVNFRYTAHGGLVIPVKKNRDPKKTSNFYPNILYMQQGATSQINLGVYYNEGPIVFGTYFRQAGGVANTGTSDAFIFLLGIRTQKVKIGFSYDAVLSEIKFGARQSYEVSLAFELKKRTPQKKVRSIRCPEF